MMNESMETPGQDAEAVSAVRGGDVERYRDLVERHERRVFAVAWSRLGDAALAEEATQEAFIRGFCRLNLLGNDAKFGPWISSIARRVAINLGFRHRRELNKRERWALEQELGGQEAARDESAELCTPETLREVLAGLPDPHRECLVLFYLEGRSGTEAAAALGIAETAFRVRLHRARGALREQLEEKLAGSLEKLRPAKSLAPAVMAGLQVSSSAKAAAAGVAAGGGVGAKVLAVLGKTFVFSWLVPFFSVIGALPGVGFAWWVGRLERRNYRETDGFRARLHRDFYRSFFWGFPLLVVVIALLNHSAVAALGFGGMLFATAGFGLVMTLVAARSLAIHRNSFQIGMVVYCAVITIGILTLALGWLSPGLAQLPMLAATAVFMLVLKHRPVRMDYSLFLRSERGLPQLSAWVDDTPQPHRFDRRTLLAFARFLGSRWLAVNFRWEKRGLALQLFPVKSTFATSMASSFVPMGRRCSHVLLGSDGTVAAHCGDTDAASLMAMKRDPAIGLTDLERRVAAVVDNAWREFRAGNQAAAARALGELPEKEVFFVSPSRSASIWWMRLVLFASMAGAVFLTVTMWRQNTLLMATGHTLKAVAVSEAGIRAALAQIAAPTNQQSVPVRLVRDMANSREVLPPTNLFTPAALEKIHALFEKSFPAVPPAPPLERLNRLLGSPALKGALLNDWLTVDYFGLDRGTARQAVAEATPRTRSFWVELREIGFLSQDGIKSNYTALDTRDLARNVLCLQKLGCLDLVDATPAIETLLRHQVLSSSLPVGRRPDLDPKLLHGMFESSGLDPVEDTWESLVILEAFGALDRVDREACVEGILRFHHGRGLFGLSRADGHFLILGDARDTFCAFESLRMLRALDRVSDLEQWKFRPMSISQPAKNGAPRMVTWEEMEAWVCQQRFERILRQHGENPQAPVRSLREQ